MSAPWNAISTLDDAVDHTWLRPAATSSYSIRKHASRGTHRYVRSGSGPVTLSTSSSSWKAEKVAPAQLAPSGKFRVERSVVPPEQSSVGDAVGEDEGEDDGGELGGELGDADGGDDGGELGGELGDADGDDDGSELGDGAGAMLGSEEGVEDGAKLGVDVVGEVDGFSVGSIDGTKVGELLVGVIVGAGVYDT